MDRQRPRPCGSIPSPPKGGIQCAACKTPPFCFCFCVRKSYMWHKGHKSFTFETIIPYLLILFNSVSDYFTIYCDCKQFYDTIVSKSSDFEPLKIVIGASPLLLLRRNTIFRVCALIYDTIDPKSSILSHWKKSLSGQWSLLRQSRTALSSGLYADL